MVSDASQQRLDVAAVTTASRSDIGKTRTENQDSCGDFLHMAGARLLIIADGMGGHRGGRRASRTCVDAFARVFRDQQGTPEDQLRQAFQLANEEIHRASLEEPEYRGMGTTAVTLYFSPDGRVLIGWVGDSRAYLVRAGVLEALTQDHALVAEWLRMGVLTPEQAASHPRRSELTRAIGIQENIEAELRVIEIEAEDRFLLCSDGLSGLVGEEDICQIVTTEDPERAVETLVDRANALGGTDNVSVQVARIPSSAVHESSARPDSIVDGRVPPKQDENPVSPVPEVRPRKRRGRSLHVPSTLFGFAFGIVTATLGFAFWSTRNDDVRIAESAPPPPESPAALASPVRGPVLERSFDPSRTEISLETRFDAAEPGSEPEAREDESPVRENRTQLQSASPVEEAASDVPASAGPLPDTAGSLPASLPLDLNEMPAPESLPDASAFDVSPAVRAFVDEWLAAATRHDYRRYRSLGFPDAPELFQRTYARWMSFRMVELSVDETRGGAERIYLRAVLSYAFEDAKGRWRTQDEHRLILEDSADGLRYVARWK